MEIFSQKISQNIFREPCMKKLHSELLELLIPLDSSFQSNEKIQTAMETLKQSRNNLLGVLVLYQLIDHCLSSKGMDLKQSRASPKILCDLKNVLATCQIQQLFHIPASSREHGEQNVLDIDPNTAVEEATAAISPHHQIALLSMIKSHVECYCLKLIQFTFPSDTFVLSSGMWEVAKYLGSIKEETNEKRLLVAKQTDYNASLVARLFKEMAEYAMQLESIISNHRYSQHSLVHLQCLSTTLKAHWLKLRCLELDILCSTYTRVSIPALAKIDATLTKRLTVAESSLAAVRNRLSKYDQLDHRFQSLMKEHACLRKDLQFFYSSKQS